MTTSLRARLGERLVALGWMRPEELELALAEQRRVHRPLGEILVELGFVEAEAIARLRAEDLGLAYVGPDELAPDPFLCSALDGEFLRQTQCLPLGTVDQRLRVALADPDDPEKLALVRARFPTELELVVTTRDALFEAARGVLDAGHSGVQRLLETDGREAPIERLVQALIEDAVRAAATDLHIEPDGKVTRVRQRVDGLLRSCESLPRELTLGVITRLKILAGLDIAERRRPQEGRIELAVDARTVDLRLSLVPCADGENAVLRILDRRASTLSLVELGIGAAHERKLLAVTGRPHGLFLVTGPTGSGKTTTLYALLSRVDALSRNVVTIEDPIEYRLPLLRQTQIDPVVGLDFGEGLRSVLRQDPDVILVGEIRDRATAEMAIRAALTGHLVFSTLHTNSALGALPRLFDLGVDPFLIEDALIGVMAQRLVRRVCRGCGRSRAPDAEDKRWLGEASPANPGRESVPALREGSGCARCAQSGYHGRTAIAELFLPDERCAAAIRSRASLAELSVLARQAGFVPLIEDGRRKVRSGATTRLEVERVCTHHRLGADERAEL